ncbi:hypothetical protein ABVT39_021697 [Epinephelus coioides]
MDSPGHTAQYCTYTTMENESKDIISVVTVDKRQTNRNSVIMEKHAFIQTFDSLLENLNITEIVTDAHMQIAALMGKHEWTRGKCDHGPLDEATRDKELMVPGSAPHEALQRVMFNRRWLKDVVKYLTFWSTLELESFQNCILMYAGKRHRFAEDRPQLHEARKERRQNLLIFQTFLLGTCKKQKTK